MNEQIKTATFAGGCFWCMVLPFDCYEGVLQVISGYTGGFLANPTYQEVRAQKSGHLEAIRLTYDERVISYPELLAIYWQQIDPTDEGGQFSDRGSSYRTAIFYHDESQRLAAEQSKADLAASGKFQKPIVTRILPAETFYPAEDYHQDYARRETEKYHADKAVEERKAFLQETWKKQ
ncbi:MAG: peptide-methionine (S)-S-oxide reductase MsrA [Negativicutes bacterium]|nr:peptide-methionine (S)-S-oxide reductase MsrA [Negativicutes bacterium]